MDEREIWLRLACIRRLSAHHAVSAATILTETCTQKNGEIRQQLHQCGLTLVQCQQFMNVNTSRLKTALIWADLPGNMILPLSSPHYPFLLKQIYSPPLVLFVAGQCEALSAPQVSMVGSRAVTHYGEKWADCFTQHLVQHNLVITSGLAAGVDGCCHKAALASGGKTVAVSGSGLSHIYPAKHRSLAVEITENGALISEYFPDVPPLIPETPEVIITPVQEELPFAHVLINVDDEPTPADIIAARCELPVTEVTTQLLQLELSGKIAVVSGGYIRLHH
ncbi:DNA-processing protein DprA [Morganella morganii]|uniref:DNA-processing protein DprA n=1 Tax=Morganella morganii TaxID=582 RepID=UPI0003DDBAA9|nr:DNA-processing protein DprA [Morganella morganii]EJG2204970.1 DNA-processing protein DprA [Morganella morganii]ELN8408357.1 DNA-processing protein DprA [Morganella morganii]MBT0401069.1 DNA-processing protein DprA [Morganella morganii subsp. morganii]MBX9345123.1 DNA-processing protein DprA [Morganella morganii]MBX9368268.1 DNA-processing protein DprA [Morganella morganii]